MIVKYEFLFNQMWFQNLNWFHTSALLEQIPLMQTMLSIPPPTHSNRKERHLGPAKPMNSQPRFGSNFRKPWNSQRCLFFLSDVSFKPFVALCHFDLMPIKPLLCYSLCYSSFSGQEKTCRGVNNWVTFDSPPLWFSSPQCVASCFKIDEFLPHKAVK